MTVSLKNKDFNKYDAFLLMVFDGIAYLKVRKEY